MEPTEVSEIEKARDSIVALDPSRNVFVKVESAYFEHYPSSHPKCRNTTFRVTIFQPKSADKCKGWGGPSLGDVMASARSWLREQMQSAGDEAAAEAKRADEQANPK